MGCVNGKIKRIDRVRLSLGRIDGLEASLVRQDRVKSMLSRIGRICGQTERIERVDGTISRVCHVGTLFYLRISPAEPQWITPDMPVTYQVESNTAWRVE